MSPPPDSFYWPLAAVPGEQRNEKPRPFVQMLALSFHVTTFASSLTLTDHAILA